MRRAHSVPLSAQALATIRSIAHDAEYSPYLFPSRISVDRPISENTISAALRRLLLSQDCYDLLLGKSAALHRRPPSQRTLAQTGRVSGEQVKETAISIRRNGKRVWRGKCASDPGAIASLLRRHAPAAAKVVFETRPLSVWFYHALTAEGLPAICIDARHAKAALDTTANKTDANDADGLAHLAEVNFFREVRVKGFDSMLTRTLVAARTRLVRIKTELSNQIRGMMKTFGLLVPAGKGSKFEEHVRSLLAGHADLASILLPLLDVWRSMRLRAAELGRQLVADARRSEACQLLMSIPGVAAVTATPFATAIEDPDNFRKSRSVGAWLGLTTRRYQSGEVNYDGHISRRGDTHVRSLLYEAATVILTRSSADSTLRTWGLKLRERVAFKRAAVAVARRLAVAMHTMLRSGEMFDRTAGAAV